MVLVPIWFVRDEDYGWNEDEEDDYESEDDAQVRQTDVERLHSARNQFIHEIL